MELSFPYDSVDISSDNSLLVILDQTQLPAKEVFLQLNEENEIFDAIYTLKVRGAPAIGIAAAFGLCVIMNREKSLNVNSFKTRTLEVISRLNSSRPTAVNLSWALMRMKKKVLSLLEFPDRTTDELLKCMFEEANAIKAEDVEMCGSISEYGLTLLKPGMGVLTHCNAGHLAVSRLGTALGPVYLAKDAGYNIRVYADETRPLLQGSRLTAFELMKYGIDVTLICDNMAYSVMDKGWIDIVFTGCDRIAKNGDVANKIGTAGLAVIAKNMGIPFYILGPSSSIDDNCICGDDIIIEERPSYEVTDLMFKSSVAPRGVKVYNPAFDITRSENITGIITEKGIYKYPYNF
ncbi:MAG: S-methyl-5-thioribose-1-phosphate isomerase [Bacteroidetes bacterium GWF2_40_14]|nr:MAG: S-methyl-5-thioribose-1-phosphate isomerase [Bacteroidetes bacterium GWF2_40_14]